MLSFLKSEKEFHYDNNIIIDIKEGQNFFDSLQSVRDNAYGTVHEIQRWHYDDIGKKEEKIDDHFMENLYRYTLAGVEYREPKPAYRGELVGEGTSERWLGA